MAGLLQVAGGQMLSSAEVGTKGMFSKMKKMVGMQEPQEETILGSVDAAITLTWKQRLIGFGCCFAGGIVLTLVSLPMLWTFHITMFAILYSIGSITSLCSTMFLMGPVRQCKKMTEEHRIIASAVYVLAIIGTLVIAFKTHNAGLVLIMLVIQIAALCWYCLTWIPGGQSFLKALIFRS